MISGYPGFGISSLVKAVLAESGQESPSRLTHRLFQALSPKARPSATTGNSAYARLFSLPTGNLAVQAVGNESRTLDALSSLSVEILFEYLEDQQDYGHGLRALGRRFLVVPGSPEDPPTLLALDPALGDVSLTRRLTNEIDIDPRGLINAFQRIQPNIHRVWDGPLANVLSEADANAVLELLWISQPEVVLSRRPRMVPLSGPSPYLPMWCGPKLSTVGIFCRDVDGDLGVSACFHGTGPVGTPVTLGQISAAVKHADDVQDLVFVPVGERYPVPPLRGRAGLRTKRAPSEAESVAFDGAGSQGLVRTRIQSHDAGILRMRPAIQLKVQTPADTNAGDSGSALIDDNDQVVAFAFERTGVGEFPELTDWIWAANAVSALGLTPI